MPHLTCSNPALQPELCNSWCLLHPRLKVGILLSCHKPKQPAASLNPGCEAIVSDDCSTLLATPNDRPGASKGTRERGRTLRPPAPAPQVAQLEATMKETSEDEDRASGWRLLFRRHVAFAGKVKRARVLRCRKGPIVDARTLPLRQCPQTPCEAR